MELFVNVNFDATSSLIIANNNNASVSLNPVFAGDMIPLSVTFVDGQGNLADFVGTPDVKILFAIGTVADRNAMTSTGTFNLDGTAYETVLDLGTNLILEAISGQESLQLFLEIQASFYDGSTETLCQQSISVRNQLIGQSVSLPAAPSNVVVTVLPEPTEFVASDIGRYVYALKSVAGRGLIEGSVYEITALGPPPGHANLQTSNNATIDTQDATGTSNDPVGVGLNFVHYKNFFRFATSDEIPAE